MLMSVVNRKGSPTLRRAIAWAAALGLVVGITVGAWAMWRSHSKQKLLASLKDDPRKVREAVQQGQISREDARDVMMDAFEARMNKTMDEYFALDAKAREKYLDKLIDEQEAMRRQWQQRAATQPATRPTTRPDRGDRPATRPAGDMQQRMRERADRTPPERTARRAEFMAAMMQRRMERGLQGGPGGGGGWGGARGGGGGGGRGAGNR